jgi:hypothetical protein
MNIITGDEVDIEVKLTKDKAKFAIAADAVIKASIIDKNHQTVLAGPVTLSHSDVGSDWANSQIMVKMSGRLTRHLSLNMAAKMQAKLEIQVDDGIRTTWFTDITLVRGTIS